MRPTITLQTHRIAIRSVMEAHRERNAHGFGSALSGKDVDGSDIYIPIDSTPESSLMNVAAIQVELENAARHAVDVLTPNALTEKFRNAVLAEAVPA
jgi:uncharacterized protein